LSRYPVHPVSYTPLHASPASRQAISAKSRDTYRVSLADSAHWRWAFVTHGIPIGKRPGLVALEELSREEGGWEKEADIVMLGPVKLIVMLISRSTSGRGIP
jgi:hypothetical protein